MALISLQEHFNEKYWWKHTYFPPKASLFHINASESITLTMEYLHVYAKMWMLEHLLLLSQEASWSLSTLWTWKLSLRAFIGPVHYTLCPTFSMINSGFVEFANPAETSRRLCVAGVWTQVESTGTHGFLHEA